MRVVRCLAEIFNLSIHGYPRAGLEQIVVVPDSALGMDVLDEISGFDGLEGVSEIGDADDGLSLYDAQGEFLAGDEAGDFLFAADTFEGVVDER